MLSTIVVSSMKVALFIATVVLGGGFAHAEAESAGDLARHEKIDQDWTDFIRKRYDLAALRQFLVTIIATKSSTETFDLKRAKLGEEWTAKPNVFVCGDWVFMPNDVFDLNQFRFIWEYRSNQDECHSVTIICVRKSRDRFRVTNMFGTSSFLRVGPGTTPADPAPNH